MSANPALHPGPSRPVAPLQPRLAALPSKPASRWRAWVILAIVAGGAWAAYRYVRKPKAQTESAAQTATIHTAKVSSGSLKRVLRLTGATTAKDFATVAAPMMRGPDSGRALIL